METTTEYSIAGNQPRQLAFADVDRFAANGAAVFRESSTGDMLNTIDSGAAVHYLEQNPGGRKEAEVLADLEQAQEDLRKRKALDHLHNLRGKVIEPLFWDFRSSLQFHLSAQHKPLVEGCLNFFDLNNLLASLRVGSAVYEKFLKASEPFCEKYDLVVEFWVQCAAVEDLNYVRNREVHCSVDDSANFISSVCDQPEAFPELDQAWAMVEALANYGSKHASALDAAAEAQHQAAAKVTAKFKQRRQQKNQQKL